MPPVAAFKVAVPVPATIVSFFAVAPRRESIEPFRVTLPSVVLSVVIVTSPLRVVAPVNTTLAPPLVVKSPARMILEAVIVTASRLAVAPTSLRNDAVPFPVTTVKKRAVVGESTRPENVTLALLVVMTVFAASSTSSAKLTPAPLPVVIFPVSVVVPVPVVATAKLDNGKLAPTVLPNFTSPVPVTVNERNVDAESLFTVLVNVTSPAPPSIVMLRKSLTGPVSVASVPVTLPFRLIKVPVTAISPAPTVLPKETDPADVTVRLFAAPTIVPPNVTFPPVAVVNATSALSVTGPLRVIGADVTLKLTPKAISVAAVIVIPLDVTPVMAVSILTVSTPVELNPSVNIVADSSDVTVNF